MSGIRQYIGARYVTKIYENSLDSSSAEWESGVIYEPLMLVTYNNGSYLSKKTVPANIGNPSANPTYWVQTGYYNGQITSLQAQIDQINLDRVKATPEMYGAVGDGVTDDTAAIQQAIDDNAYVVANGNYAITHIDIHDNYKIVEFNGTLNHIGTASNFSVKTTEFTDADAASWIGEYSSINKYAVKISGRWCRVFINRLYTAQSNAVGVLVEPNGTDGLVDDLTLKVNTINGTWACALMLYGEDGQNVQYNNFDILNPIGSISAIALIAADSGSFVNANFFSESNPQSGGIDIILQNVDNDYGSDNWFDHTSFEGVTLSHTVRCYNMKHGGLLKFRYEEVASKKMYFKHCHRLILDSDTYMGYSSSLSITDSTSIIFKGYIDYAGGTRYVFEDIADWKWISQTVSSTYTITNPVGITGSMHRFGNIVETYINGSGTITVPPNYSLQIGEYNDRYMSEHDDLYFTCPDNPNLSIRFNLRKIYVVNSSGSSITMTLKPQLFRWITNRMFA